MNFKLWLELEFKNNVEPKFDISTANWIDQKNPQEVERLRKNLTYRNFEMKLKDETFIHFTLTESISAILESKYITVPAFAVSCTYGIWLPVVQFNHIINKKKQNLFNPATLKNISKNPKLADKYKNFSMPNFSQDISAIIFKTNTTPKFGRKEEVYWEAENINLIEAKLLSTREAINILKHTPKTIEENDIIYYS